MSAPRACLPAGPAALLLALFLLPPPSPVRADDSPPIQRHLANLHFGDSLETVQRIYAPARDWPAYVEPRGHVKRMRVERLSAKKFPQRVETLWLGFKGGGLVEIQLVYDAEQTREKPVEELAGDLALLYGEANRTEDKFWWMDGSTVLRVYYTQVPVLREGRRVVELRTTIQVMERALFRRRE